MDTAKKIQKKKKSYTFGILIALTFVLIMGIQKTYAYYYENHEMKLLAAQVGDFDLGDGDINIIIYKQLTKGADIYGKTYSVPAIGYSFNDKLTKCFDEAKHEMKCKNESSNGENGNCHYKYDDKTRTFALTSNQKVTCKFYFDQEVESDINVYIMKEDSDGVDGQYKEKNYTLVSGIPSFGYKYAGAKCDEQDINGDNDMVSYDAENKKFTVKTNKKTTCYAYFDKDGEADIITNVYIKKRKTSQNYELVDYIPINNTYTLNSEMSKCKFVDEAKNSQEEASKVTYEEGYINIKNIKEKQVCDVYLDLAS